MIVLTTTYPARQAMCHSVLTRVMTLATDNEFVVQHYGDFDEKALRCFADFTENYIQFNRQPDDRSVCHTKRAFTPRTMQERWLNLDDDIFMHADALPYHQHMSPSECVSTGVVDIANGRGYEHWTLDTFNIDTFPLEQSLIGYFRIKQRRALMGDLRTQLYSVPMDSLTDAIWGEVEAKYAEKGVRGYDIALFNSYKQNSGYRMSHRTGAESMHLGVDTPFLNNEWTSHVT